MQIMEATTYGLRRQGKWHVVTSHDAKNAFPSIPHGRVDLFYDRSAPDGVEANILKARHRRAATRIQAQDQELVVQIGQGALQGDRIAGEIFREQYEPAVVAWS